MAKKQKVRVKYRRKKQKPQTTMSKIMRYALPVAYGFGRDKVSDFIMKSKLGQQLPITNFTDEGIMLGVGFLVSKMGLTKNPTVRQLVSHSRTIELNNIGRTWSDLNQAGQSLSVQNTIGVW